MTDTNPQRTAVLSALSSPDWHPVPEAHGMPWSEAEALLDAYDASRAAASAPVSPAPADQAALLRELADRAEEWDGHITVQELRRMANEADYVATPCSVGGCEPGGEPCTTHERLMAHAEGDHELCAPDCVPASGPGGVAGETPQPERLRCPHCRMPHDLTPDVAAVCASIRASIAEDEAKQPETQADDEGLRAKVDDATSTLRRIRTALRTLKEQGATGQTYYQVITNALAGPRPDGTPEPETEADIVREHVTTVHLIGEQLADVESWLWKRLAEVRAEPPVAVSQPDEEAAPCTCAAAGAAFAPAGHYADCPQATPTA
jgi:hypothetical protein